MAITEYEKMLAGELYDAKDPQLVQMRFRVPPADAALQYDDRRGTGAASGVAG